MFYVTVILFTMILDIGIATALSLAEKSITLVYAIIAPFFILAYVLIILGILDLLLRFLPKSFYDFNKKYYIVSKKEMKFYEKISIRKWENIVPELGSSGGFSKRHLKSIDSQYIRQFIHETCFGEILHLFAGILGFTCLLFFSSDKYLFVLPILIVNLILNLLPCLIQRYNRHKLVTLYNFKTRCNQSRIINVERETITKEEVEINKDNNI